MSFATGCTIGGMTQLKTSDVRHEAFEYIDEDKWMKAAVQSLKNKPFEALYRNTYEGITLKPLYTAENAPATDQYPGGGFYTRGFRSTGYAGKGWGIAQQAEASSWEGIKERLSHAFIRGQNTFSFNLDGIESMDSVNFNELGEISDLALTPFWICTAQPLSAVLRAVQSIKKDTLLSGAIGTDIVSRDISDGRIPDEETLKDWTDAVIRLDKIQPNIKTIWIHAVPYHEGGANAVQEAGAALAEAVFYIEHMKVNAGWDPSKTAGKLAFQFGIGGNFFIEIAKLRSFRKLWSLIADSYGLSGDGIRPLIGAETSAITKSVLDPYVNMLRAGNEAFAAVSGGVDMLHVMPYDKVMGGTDEFSERIARNTQLLLRSEAHLDKVIDPAGGSYYIEAITEDLVKRGWSFFQKIDAMGGILEVLKSGWLQSEIDIIQEQRTVDIKSRKKSLVGVNHYANLSESIRFAPDRNTSSLSTTGAIRPLKIRRLAEPFEMLRKRSLILSRTRQAPKAGLICLGSLKEHKGRADFIAGFLAAGGIEAERSQPIETIGELKKFVADCGASYFCLCGTDGKEQEMAPEIGKWLSKEKPDIILDAAGHFSDEEKEQFLQNGIQGFIYAGQNIYEKLDALLTGWEERADA